MIQAVRAIAVTVWTSKKKYNVFQTNIIVFTVVFWKVWKQFMKCHTKNRALAGLRFRSCWNIVSKLNLAPSIFIIGSVWRWNWYCTHINLNNVILWGIIPICKIFAKTWHFLFCFGVCYSFCPFALTRECALHLRPCEKRRKTYFAVGLAGFSKTKRTVPE